MIAECAVSGMAGFVELGLDRFDLDRHQVLAAQLGACRTRAVGVDYAVFGGPCRIDGFITECWHGVSLFHFVFKKRNIVGCVPRTIAVSKMVRGTHPTKPSLLLTQIEINTWSRAV